VIAFASAKAETFEPVQRTGPDLRGLGQFINETMDPDARGPALVVT